MYACIPFRLNANTARTHHQALGGAVEPVDWQGELKGGALKNRRVSIPHAMHQALSFTVSSLSADAPALVTIVVAPTITYLAYLRGMYALMPKDSHFHKLNTY